MLLTDQGVPYPRQYLRDDVGNIEPSLPTDKRREYDGYVVPFAGARPLWVWWTRASWLTYDRVQSERELQARDGWQVRTYPFPETIVVEAARASS